MCVVILPLFVTDKIKHALANNDNRYFFLIALLIVICIESGINDGFILSELPSAMFFTGKHDLQQDTDKLIFA